MTQSIEILSVNCENGVPYYTSTSIKITAVPFKKDMFDAFTSLAPEECPVKKF